MTSREYDHNDLGGLMMMVRISELDVVKVVDVARLTVVVHI